MGRHNSEAALSSAADCMHIGSVELHDHANDHMDASILVMGAGPSPYMVRAESLWTCWRLIKLQTNTFDYTCSNQKPPTSILIHIMHRSTTKSKIMTHTISKMYHVIRNELTRAPLLFYVHAYPLTMVVHSCNACGHLLRALSTNVFFAFLRVSSF